MKVKSDIKIKASKNDLNWLSLMADAAAATFLKKGHDGLADRAQTLSNDIFKALKEAGYYDDLEDNND